MYNKRKNMAKKPCACKSKYKKGEIRCFVPNAEMHWNPDGVAVSFGAALSFAMLLLMLAAVVFSALSSQKERAESLKVWER
jgi:hypothetical protein